MIKLTDILKEIEISKPGKISIKVTNKSYIDVNSDIIIEFIYQDSEFSTRSSEFNDTLQNVVKELKQNINNLYSDHYKFTDLHKYMSVELSEIFDVFTTKDEILTLVDYYNKNQYQELLEYILEAQSKTEYWQQQEDKLYIEGNSIMDPTGVEIITLNEVKEGIEEILLPFVTLYNQLGNTKFTIGDGEYVGEDFIIEADDDGIWYTESLMNEDFNRVLSVFTKNGYITIDKKDYNENPEVF